VTCTASTRTGQLAALLLAQLDLTALTLLGGPPELADDLAGAALAHARTHLPRARIIGADVAGAGPITAAALAVEIVDAILCDRRRALRVAVQALEDARVAVREARIGAGGVQTFL
jgi:hypothetical protein